MLLNSGYFFAPVAQRIECKLAELVIEVRFLAGAEN